MEGAYISCFCLSRLLLPISLAVSVLFRQNLLSFIYLLLIFYLPWVEVPTVNSMKGFTGKYLQAVMLCSILTTVAQLSFQIVLLSMPPYGNFLEYCELLEKILRHIGFVRLDDISTEDAVRAIGPEVLMLVSSSIVYILCSKISSPAESNTSTVGGGDSITSEATVFKDFSFFIGIGKYICLACLCLAAAVRPSVFGATYYLIVIGSMTWWACCKDLQRVFAIVLYCILFIVGIHITTLFCVEIQWIQEYLPNNCSYCRYFAIEPLISYNCLDPRTVTYNVSEWTYFINPVILIGLYYILGLEAKHLLRPRVAFIADARRDTLTENTPLLNAATPSSKYRLSSRRNNSPAHIFQDQMGSVTLSQNPEDSIQLQNFDGTGGQEHRHGFCDIILDCITSLFQLVNQSSYIATNIIMMAWSITYHSWLTFVLLLWASILWMVKNHRLSMLKCSPFLVLYAEFLLLAQYLYSMNLTEEELPQVIDNINLQQIGFAKLPNPYKPILAKTLFTVMFWITLRQYLHERRESRSTSALEDLASPLQVTVNTATSGSFNEEEQTATQSFLKNAGALLKQFLTKFWIWVVVIMLFVIGITGERMTIFRIVYTALFLIFILVFQLSYQAWRKMMCVFWYTVILYSMCILVMVYTYQFDHFSDYWADYLHIPKSLQLDIGMERFETGELFIRLLTPTFFVVITIIQVHYFHHDFLKLSDIKSRAASLRQVRGARSEKDSSDTIDEADDAVRPTSTEEPLPEIPHILYIKKEDLIIILKGFKRKLNDFVNLIWLFLELHMIKLIQLSVFLLCVYDVCTLHFALVLLVVLSLSFGNNVHTFTIHVCSIFISVLMLSKMIYQIEYIKHDKYNINCTANDSISQGNNNNVTLNDAEWLGFRKTTSSVSLPMILQGYIGLIVVITVFAVVKIRQKYRRQSLGFTHRNPSVMFQSVKRTDADTNLSKCFKYMMNYGFYKFGVEICLIATVALIGTRLDFYASLYCIWLLIMFSLKRGTLGKIWILYQIFIVIIIPLQYIMVVGLPPGLCIDYPWDSSTVLRGLQEWLYLPDPFNQPVAEKLICDFILLILVCRQSVVNRIEKKHELEDDYPGGSNKDITGHFDDPLFNNPIPDFKSHIRSWLDIVKRGVFSSLLWITLAVVFLAGTNRVNFFSLGYLIGSFIFLWQGEDLYLRPINTIIRWWNLLLGYNVAVLVLKTLSQIPGCIFFEWIKDQCWFVQLFGIACIRKFDPTATAISNDECVISSSEIGLAWDGVCFSFLLLMRRLFQSHYFIHLMNETKAMTILASRGAELIEELSRKQIADQQQREHQILEKIKQKMERIKASQQKAQPANHFQAFDEAHRRRHCGTYVSAIRSGDYYMFEELDDGILDTEKDSDGGSEYKSDTRRPTLSQFLNTALKTDIEQAADMALVPPKSPTEASSDYKSLQQKNSSMYFSALTNISDAQPSSTDIGDRSDQVPHTSKADKGVRKTKYEETDDTKAEKKIDDTKSEKKIDSSLAEKSYDDAAAQEKRKDVSCIHKLGTYIKFTWALMESAMVTLALYLNQFSRDYRYVIKVLAMEKKLLKERPGFGEGIRRGTGMVWHPLPGFRNFKEISSHTMTLDEMDEKELKASEQPPFIRLLLAVWFAIFAHSDMVCYFTVFLLQVKSPTILSLPLPLMVLLWGSLSVPRPSKTFWVTLIAYTEVIVVLKCMFQFEIIPWNQQVIPDNIPFYPPRILGIEKKKMYANYDLALLLIAFFHRFMLKSLGLWKTTFEGENFEKKIEIFEIVDKPDTVNEAHSSTTIAPGDVIKTKGGLHMVKKYDYTEATVIPAEDKKRNLVAMKTKVVSAFSYFPQVIFMSAAKYFDSVKIFFQDLLSSNVRVTADVYAYLFICDFTNFFVVVFGFASFGTQQGDGGISSYLRENRIPIPFLIMLVLQFALIIMDRALYLRKFILGKIIFQFFLVIGVHIWMFFVLPAVTERSFNAALPPQIWYVVKCFYLLLSAYQIRSGYPTRILGNFLCKKYNMINMLSFKGFMLVPFLFELRALMDWVWTDTSMTLWDWLKMEDIFSNIFQRKCSRQMEEEYPQARGEKKSSLVKYIMGGSLLFLIIGIIWFPMVFFALGKAVGEANVPHDITLSLRIGPFQSVYDISAQEGSIFQFSEKDFNNFVYNYRKDRTAQTFLSSYDFEDISAVKIGKNSTKIWGISPPDYDRLIDEVESDEPVKFKLTWMITRSGEDPAPPTAISSETFIMKKDNPQRNVLLQILQSTGPDDSTVTLQNIFPKFLKVTEKGKVELITQLSRDGKKQDIMRNLTMKLYHPVSTTQRSADDWWELSETCRNSSQDEFLKHFPYWDCDYLLLYIFSDKVFPSTLSFISAGGIIGLYTTMVLIASNIVRGFFTGICFTIMFDDMPYVDRILQLCLDIYLVRESREFCLEEDLFAKLVFLYRSPETLIKWTRPREEGDPDGAEEIEEERQAPR